MARKWFKKKKSRKGIVGIEAAIVLIAFVLVASALAFVVLNMGMFTTQKSKEVIARAYEESTRALDIAGSVVAYVSGYNDPSTAYVDSIVIPIKLTAGARPIDLSKTTVRLTLIDPDGNARQIDNAYVVKSGVTFILANETTDPSLSGLVSSAGLNPFEATWIYSIANEKDENGFGDNLLEPGEIVLLMAKVSDATNNFKMTAYSRIMVEIQPPAGSPLTIERTVPASLDSEIVNLDVG